MASDSLEFTDIEKPTFSKTRLSPSEILLGGPVPKLDRVRIMSDDEFETFVGQWAWGHLKTKYQKIGRFGGAGDKGRDVLGYYKDGTFDIYQCKHYASPISLF